MMSQIRSRIDYLIPTAESVAKQAILTVLFYSSIGYTYEAIFQHFVCLSDRIGLAVNATQSLMCLAIPPWV